MRGFSRTGGTQGQDGAQPREFRGRAPRVRRVLAGVLAAGALLSAGPADAQGDKDLVLFLSVRSRDRHDGRLTQSLSQRLSQAREKLIADRALSVVERDCDTADCMSQLASREEARFVLRTNIEINDVLVAPVPGWILVAAPREKSVLALKPEKKLVVK